MCCSEQNRYVEPTESNYFGLHQFVNFHYGLQQLVNQHMPLAAVCATSTSVPQ
jgi:hypothetical protein